MAEHQHSSDHLHATVIDDYADKYTNNQLDELDEVLHPELQIRELLGIEETFNFEQYAEWAHGVLEAFPDTELINYNHIVEGDMIATRTVMTGTHKGELLGIGPTNTELVVPWQLQCRIEDGKVIEKWDKPDTFRMFTQIGEFPDSDALPDPNPGMYK